MNELTNEELIMRIAKTKASGLTATAYFKLMGFNKNYVYNARRQLTSRGLVTPEIDDLITRRIDALRSWMDKSPIERDEFVSLYHSYLERPKDVSEHQFCSEAGIGDYEFRKLRAGYKYFTDIFEKLDSKDAAATVNTGVDGPIRIVYTGDKKEGVVPKCFVEEKDKEDLANDQFTNMGPDKPLVDDTILYELKPGTYIPGETTIIRAMPDGTEKHSGRYPWGDDVSEEETTDDGYDPFYYQHVIQICMSRYIKNELDRMFNVDIPYDIDNIDKIFINIADLIDAFLTLR